MSELEALREEIAALRQEIAMLRLSQQVVYVYPQFYPMQPAWPYSLPPQQPYYPQFYPAYNNGGAAQISDGRAYL